MRGVHKRLVVYLAFMLCSLLFSASTPRAQGQGREYEFRGTVESVDAKAQTLTVGKVVTSLKDGKGEGGGWTQEFSQAYKVDKPDVLGRVKAGEQIVATVFETDMGTLHDVQAAPPAKQPAPPAKQPPPPDKK